MPLSMGILKTFRSAQGIKDKSKISVLKLSAFFEQNNRYIPLMVLIKLVK